MRRSMVLEGTVNCIAGGLTLWCCPLLVILGSGARLQLKKDADWI
jgi:hypothetical protein